MRWIKGWQILAIDMCRKADACQRSRDFGFHFFADDAIGPMAFVRQMRLTHRFEAR